jgi:hypothetical protein
VAYAVIAAEILVIAGRATRIPVQLIHVLRSVLAPGAARVSHHCGVGVPSGEPGAQLRRRSARRAFIFSLDGLVAATGGDFHCAAPVSSTNARRRCRLFEAFIFLCGTTHLIGIWAWAGFGSLTGASALAAWL